MNSFAFFLAAAAALVGAASAQGFNHGKIVSCYYSSWAFYRVPPAKFDVDDFDPFLCSHGFYGFADLNNGTWEIDAWDPWFDLAASDCTPGYCNYDGFRRFTALRNVNPDFVPMLSIGGWNAGSEEYSIMAKDPVKRQIFVDSLVPFLRTYGFMGLDLDWEYPGMRPGSDYDVDKEDFVILMNEVSDALHSEGMILTSAVSGGYLTIEVAYDIPALSQYLDFFNVMCYDYHGWFPEHGYTGHNSPLRNRDDENFPGHPAYRFNTVDTIEYYIELGMPLDKMVLGMASYGRGFQLVDNSINGIYCAADDGFPMGPYTGQKGFYSYFEILEAQVNSTLLWMPEATPGQWTIVRDSCYEAPYMYNGPYWIGYDDEESIATKVRYANGMNLAGVMIWTIEQDDFLGLYSDRPYPMMNLINEVLESGETYVPSGICSGSAPMCTIGDNGLEGLCDFDGQMRPYPENCHNYFECEQMGDGSFEINIHTCGEYAWDVSLNTCVDPAVPGNENIC